MELDVTVFQESNHGSLTLEEVKKIHLNRKILAIKSVRARTGLSLRDSKKLVDSFDQYILRSTVNY